MTRVLVVDDEETVREVLADALSNAGFEVAEASEGETALEIASREPINVILLDVQMPEMDGFQMLRRLRESPEAREFRGSPSTRLQYTFRGYA